MDARRSALLSLAVILAAAGATALAWRLRPPPPPPPAESNRPVFDFPPSTVRGIDIQSWQGTLRAERRGAGWQVSVLHPGRSGGDATPEPGTPAPSADEVNQVVSGLVREVVELPQVDRFPRDSRPLEDYGLAKPQAVIALELDSGKTLRLEIGALTITSTAVYARVAPPDDVIEIGSVLFSTIDGALYRLRGLAEKLPAGGASERPERTG